MQVQVKPAFYQCFGGINFIEADFNALNFETLITRHLGSRSHQALYSYSDVIKHLLLLFAIGGDVVDDLNTLKAQLGDHPYLSICSPDTVEYVCNQLKTATYCQLTDKGVQHYINEHAGFNQLLAAISVAGATLNTKDAYTLDYDGHILENTKGDNACNYKHTRSYYPVVCSINKLPSICRIAEAIPRKAMGICASSNRQSATAGHYNSRWQSSVPTPAAMSKKHLHGWRKTTWCTTSGQR